MMKLNKKRFGFKITIAILLTLLIDAAFIMGIFAAFAFSIDTRDSGYIMLFLGISIGISILCATLLSISITAKTTKTLTSIADAFNEVANGNFNVDLKIDQTDIFKDFSNDFHKMTKELASIQTLRNDFISNFSHEFQTPIASINGFSEILLNNKLSESEQKEYLKIIFEESLRLSSLSENILLMSRLDSQSLITEKCTYQLDEQLRNCILILQKEWESKKISIIPNLESIKYNGNEQIMQQVWINIINNAIKYTSEHGKITINLSSNKQKIIIEISDNGIGMSEEIMNHIFDKFYQGDSSRSSAGNGLGLAIVQRIIQLCNGSINVTSKINEGSKFTIVLNNI